MIRLFSCQGACARSLTSAESRWAGGGGGISKKHFHSPVLNPGGGGGGVSKKHFWSVAHKLSNGHELITPLPAMDAELDVIIITSKRNFDVAVTLLG